MGTETTIAAGTIVRGSIEGNGDLVVAGHVEGEIALSGEVTVESSGLVGASVRAARILVRGAVRGDLTAADSVVLEEGARVVGDVRGARIAVGRGALVRGYVETGGQPAAPVVRRETVAARPAPRVVEAPARREPPAPPTRRAEPAAAAPPAPSPVAKREPPPAAAAPREPAPSLLAGMKREPPAPVVPALRKGAKAKKKSV